MTSNVKCSPCPLMGAVSSLTSLYTNSCLISINNSGCKQATNEFHSFIVLQAETIMRISEYVKNHPRASEAQLKAEVEKEIKLFAQKIAELEAIH